MVARKGYKLTEVGEIPEDWGLESLSKSIKDLQAGCSVNSEINGTSKVYILKTSAVYDGKVDLKHIKPVSCREITRVKCHIKQGCILISRMNTPELVGACGYSAQTIENIFLPDRLWQSVPNKCNTNFVWLTYLLNTVHYKYNIKELATGTSNSMKNIAKKKILSLAIPLPSLKEQNAIATALSDADALIDALEQSIVKKRQIKQGAMQELLTGKRRLPGFTGKWANWELGKVLVVTHGKSQKFVEDPNGEYPILASGGKIGTANQFIYNKPSILIGRKGTIDKPQYMDRPFWAVDTLFYTQVNQNNILKFIYYIFFLIPWHNYNEASGVPSLNAKTIESILVKLPPPDENGKPKEQTAIANILSDMDDEIAALEAKLAKARQIKIGMMQELLTGRIRLV